MGFKLTKAKVVNLSLKLVLAAHLFGESSNVELHHKPLRLVFRILAIHRMALLLRSRKIFQAVLLALAYIKFKINREADPHNIYHHLIEYLRFGRFGLKMPPNATTRGLALSIKYGPWQRHKLERELVETVGPIFSITGIDRMFVMCSDPDLVKEIMLDKQGFPSRGPTGFSDITQNGLLGLPSGERHTQHRRLIGSFMSNRWMETYAKVIQSECEILLEKWDKLCAVNQDPATAKETNVTYDLSMLTLEVIMNACVGNSAEKYNQQMIKEEDNIMAQGLDFALKEIVLSTTLPLLKFFPSASVLRYKTQYRAMWARAIDKCKEIAKKPKAPLMIYSALAEAKNEDGSRAISDEEINDEMNTIRGAGHETTSNTVAWTLLLLIRNPDCLRKVQEEVDSVVKGTTVTYEESKKLSYCHQVIYETLRMYPTVPSFPREAAYDLKLGGYDIPKNTLVFCSQNGLNKDPKLWPEPDLFNPERFKELPVLLPSKPVGQPNGHSFGFLPFGAGNRTCIGQRLAMLEAVQMLGAIAKKFNFKLSRPHSAINEVADVTLGPKNGLYLKFEKRSIV